MGTQPVPTTTQTGKPQTILQEQLEKDPSKNLALFSDTKRGKELISWVSTQYEAMKSARKTVLYDWYQNLKMYYGEHYFELDRTSAIPELKVPIAPKHRVRATINLIRPMIRTEISRLTSQAPIATVVPSTGEEDDMSAALAAEACLQYTNYRDKFTSVIMPKMAFWMCITGIGFIKTWWDDNKIDPFTRLAIPPNEDTANMVGAVAKGNVCRDAVSPFNLFVPELLIENIQEQPWVFEVYTKSVEWAKSTFGDVFEKQAPIPDARSKTEIFESSYLNVTSNQRDAEPDSCLLIEAWVKPHSCALLPNGGKIIVCAGKIVQIIEDGLPYSHNEYPYVRFPHLPTGTFYSQSVIIDTRSLNKEYNRTRSQIIESKNKMGRPQMSYVEGSINPNKWTSQPGLLIPYKMGFAPPNPIPMQPLPQYVLDELDRIKADMSDISGQHDASRGRAPGGGVEAATAISYLQEKDDSLLATSYLGIEAGCENIARQTLQLIVDYWDMKRLIRTVGADGAFDTYQLKGADIANALDVRMESGSALPLAKPARQALLMDLYTNGAITGPQMLDMMNIGGINKLTELLRVDKKQAQRENLRMKMIDETQLMEHQRVMLEQVQNGGEGQQDPITGDMYFNQDPSTWPPMIPVNDWDNHEVHIEVHNMYRKGQEFETLPDFIKEEFNKHVQMHKNALQKAAMDAMMGAGGVGAPPEMQGMQGMSGMPPDMMQAMSQVPQTPPQSGASPEMTGQEAMM